jgi:hypothetical protein
MVLPNWNASVWLIEADNTNGDGQVSGIKSRFDLSAEGVVERVSERGHGLAE